jgi:hypothetical protein
MAMLDPIKAAERLGIPAQRLKNWRNSGLGPAFVRLSHKTVVYDSETIDEFIRSRTRQPSVQAFAEYRRDKLKKNR